MEKIFVAASPEVIMFLAKILSIFIFNKNFSTFSDGLGALDIKTNLFFNLYKFFTTSIAPG
jgi:uncharacterized membrane protein YpjA